ncbi:unnamed protein product [Cylicocyclus nassatus]|uniref:Uncharacterized protein n=1 Tax=Cylicocyclus nassatus TaxID=53992 RepID=A0AA36DP11_CYLNA|nr:unnamed protein product [Cylicocyclus nassatus]
MPLFCSAIPEPCDDVRLSVGIAAKLETVLEQTIVGFNPDDLQISSRVDCGVISSAKIIAGHPEYKTEEEFFIGNDAAVFSVFLKQVEVVEHLLQLEVVEYLVEHPVPVLEDCANSTSVGSGANEREGFERKSENGPMPEWMDDGEDQET